MPNRKTEGWIETPAKRELLSEFLSWAVPLEIIKLHQECRPWTSDWAWIATAQIADDRREEEALDLGDMSNYEQDFNQHLKGISVYFGSKLDCLVHNDPATHKVFARLARTIAIFSFHPEGFKFLDYHWKAIDYWQHRGCDCVEIDADPIPGCAWTIADLPNLQTRLDASA